MGSAAAAGTDEAILEALASLANVSDVFNENGLRRFLLMPDRVVLKSRMMKFELKTFFSFDERKTVFERLRYFLVVTRFTCRLRARP